MTWRVVMYVAGTTNSWLLWYFTKGSTCCLSFTLASLVGQPKGMNLNLYVIYDSSYKYHFS
jgi:hypothetical protein